MTSTCTVWSCSATAVVSPEATASESSGSRATVQATGTESASEPMWVQIMTRSVSGSPLATPCSKRFESGKAGNLYRRPPRWLGFHFDDYLRCYPAHWPAATAEERAAASPYAEPGFSCEAPGVLDGSCAAASHEEDQQRDDRQREQHGVDDRPAGDGDDQQDNSCDKPQHEHSSFRGLTSSAHVYPHRGAAIRLASRPVVEGWDGRCRARTGDLFGVNEALSQLS